MTILLILALLGLLLLLVRALYDRFWDRGLACRVEFAQEYAVEGDDVSLTEVLVNDKLLPMPVVEIDFHMDKRLRFGDGENASVSDQTYRRDVFALSPRQKITRTLDLHCAGRGYFRIESTGVTARDLFLTRKYLASSSQRTELYVLPRPLPVHQLQIPFSRIMGEALSRKKIYDDPFEFAGLRDYSRGDPMKYINWKATARAGDLLTNLHESTLSQRVTLLLDMEGKGVAGADALNEAAVRIAASLSERLLAAGISLTVRSNGLDVQTGQPLALENITGSGSVLYLKKKLACVQSGNGLAPITDFSPDTASPGSQEPLLILITRSQREDGLERFAAAVGKGRGMQIIPYRDSHSPLPSLSSVEVAWLEV